ncbi:MAG: hypothetical protein VB082_03005 [Christensenella sp.]|nr:hypothetical protein [Christensenella sp.]
MEDERAERMSFVGKRTSRPKSELCREAGKGAKRAREDDSYGKFNGSKI